MAVNKLSSASAVNGFQNSLYSYNYDEDPFAQYLKLALPFNSEWGFHDASAYIRKDYSKTNPYLLNGANNTAVISSGQSKFYGQSAYFDGAADDVQYYSPGTLAGDFTVEFWYYATSVVGIKNFFTWGDGSWKNLRNTGGTWQIETASNNGGVSVSGNIVPNAWTHFAITRSGSSVRFFSNGIQIGSTQTSTAVWGTHESFRIGRRTASVTEDFQGYLQDFRIYEYAKYTKDFSVPNQMVKYVGDSSGKNFLIFAAPFNSSYGVDDMSNVIRGWGERWKGIAEGNAAISSSQSKFYGQSLYLDGSGGDQVNFGPVGGQEMICGDYTIELWAYTAAQMGASTALCSRYHSEHASYEFWMGCSPNTTTHGFWWYGTATGNIQAATPSNTGTWRHYAATKSGSTVRWFLDGVLQGSATSAPISSLTLYPQSFIVGGSTGNVDGNKYPYNGYIQDVRVYKGFAKYTSNFTPPASGIAI